MAKKPKGRNYVSKGERSNISRSLRNELRRERRANPSMRSIFAKVDHKNTMLAKKGRDASKDLFLAKADIERRALELFNKYKSKGVEWSACVQAVKTNWIPQFETKWHNIAM